MQVIICTATVWPVRISDRRHLFWKGLHQVCWDRKYNIKQTLHWTMLTLFSCCFMFWWWSLLSLSQQTIKIASLKIVKEDLTLLVVVTANLWLCLRPKINVFNSCDRSFWHCQLHFQSFSSLEALTGGRLWKKTKTHRLKRNADINTVSDNMELTRSPWI